MKEQLLKYYPEKRNMIIELYKKHKDDNHRIKELLLEINNSELFFIREFEKHSTLITFILLLTLTLNAQSDPEYDTIQLTDTLNRELPLIINNFIEEVPGLSIAVVYKDQTIFSQGYGYRELEEELLVNSDTHFRLASVSKTVTAVCILILQEQGKIDLNDPAEKYLPEFENLSDPFSSAKEITILDLLSHRSGLPKAMTGYYSTGDIPLDILALHILNTTQLINGVGEGFSYSNNGYVLPERIIEVASGIDFNSFLNEELFIGI